MNWQKAVIAGLLCLPFIIMLALGFGRDPHALPSMREGKPAPDFSLEGLDGKTYALKDLHDKPVLLNFWSTWCQTCKYEHDLLLDAARTYGNDLHFLGIIFEDKESAVRAYLEREGQAYPHLIDPQAVVAINYGVAAVPESFFIDRTGQVLYKRTGVLTPEILKENLRKLLAPR